jgi:3-oxoacyl-(acyl-carrier-protein) synthase
MISYPFTVRDCCLVTDGGGAIVIERRACQILKKAPAYVARLRPRCHACEHLRMPDLTVTGAKAAGEAAYKMAKLTAKDIDMVRAL